jgi:oligosaccharide repeat unit polymerase
MSLSGSTLELALLGQVIVWLAVILVFFISRQASIHHPLWVYLFFHGLVFVVRPILVHFLKFDTEWQYMQFEPDDLQQIHVLAASSLALIVLTISMFAFGWCRTEFKSPAPKPYTAKQKTALLVVTLILAPLIAYSIRSFMTGGLQVEERNNIYVMVGDSGYTVESQFMAGPLICAWLAVKGFRWPALLPVIPYVAYRAYCGTARTTIVLLFLEMVLVYAWYKRLKWVPGWALLCVVPVFLLFKTMGDNRDFLGQMLRGEEYRRPTSLLSGIEKWKAKYDSPDFSNFDSLAFIMATVPDRTGTYTYGVQYLQLFTEPIPRKLWKGKPTGAPVRSFNLNNYGHFFGLTASCVGDGWVSGGWVGIVVLMTLVGALLGRAHRWFWKHSDSNMVPLFYLVALAMSPQWFRDGGISIAKFLFWNLSPLLFWSVMTWVLGRRLLPAYSIVLPGNSRVRLLGSESKTKLAEPVVPVSNPGS